MIAVDEVQAKVHELISAHEAFADIQVIIDLGAQDAEAEQALREPSEGDTGGNGVAVMISPILGFTTTDEGGSVVVGDAESMVSILVNPHANTTEQTPLYFVKKAIEAVKAYEDPKHKHFGKFMIPPDGFSLTAFDPGLFAYNVMLRKRCVL